MALKELCAKIREKRRELGLSVEEVVEKTKLNPSVITNIEEADFGHMSPIYAKGFVKIYADFLKIDVGDGLEEILHTKPAAPAKKPLTATSVKKTESKSYDEPMPTLAEFVPQIKRFIFVVIAAALCLWIIGSVFKFIGNIARRFTRPKAQTEQQDPASDGELVVFDENKKSTSKKSSSTSKEMIVSVRAKRNCFIKVKVDGKVLFQGILKRDTAEVWKGKKEVDLQIQDGSAVYIEVNGKSLPSLTSMRKPIKSLNITPSGIRVKK